MRQSNNKLDIEGIVSEKNIRDIEKNGKKYISGEIIVEVQLPVKDKNGKEVIQTLSLPVSFISANVKKDGGANKNYAALQKLKEFDTIASSGRENATKVQIRGARIRENSFASPQTNEIVRGIKLESNFFTKTSDATFVPTASYMAEIFILDIQPEQKSDAEGNREDTGRLIVKGAVTQWGDQVEVIDFIAEDKAYVDFINQNWKKGDTVSVGGYPKFTSELVEKSTELGFGEAQVSSYTKRSRELIITRGSRGPLDEEFAFPKEEIAKAMTERKARLDTILENARKPKENKAEGKAQDADSWDNF